MDDDFPVRGTFCKQQSQKTEQNNLRIEKLLKKKLQVTSEKKGL